MMNSFFLNIFFLFDDLTKTKTNSGRDCMTIEYCCNNCGKKFKPREYMKLEIIRISDDKDAETLVSRGRKCDSCDKEIKVDDKIVKM